MNNKLVLKHIPVAPNYDYMAGSDGQIYSRTKKGYHGKRKQYVDWYPMVGHLGSRKNNLNNYKHVTMCHKGIKVCKTVHRLVCMAFHGMPKKQSLQTRHLNGNPHDNRPRNLAWGTQYENWLDSVGHNRVLYGEKNHNSKLKDWERKALTWAIDKKLCTRNHASKALGMAVTSIGRSYAKEKAKV